MLPEIDTPLRARNAAPSPVDVRTPLQGIQRVWQGACTLLTRMARGWRERSVRRVAGAALVALAASVVGGCATPDDRRAQLSEPVPVILAQGSSWELVLPGAGAEPGVEHTRNARALGYGRPTSPASVTTDPGPRIQDRRYILIPRQPDRVLIFTPEPRGRR